VIRAAIIALALASMGLGVVTTRALWQGRSALAAGDEADARGDVAAAIERYRRAARWYVPGAPHVREAYERLEALAEAAEREGDEATALRAWRGVRSSILATRGVRVPFEERLERANQRIAHLLAAQQAEGEDARSAMLEELERPAGPSPAWMVLALFGLGLWIGGGALFATRGVTRDDALQPRYAAAAGVLVALGLIFWLLGLAVS
jgi:hypothetical protein